MHAFPSPQRLAKLGTFPGRAGRKPEWLGALAQAALDGQLARAVALAYGLPAPATPEQILAVSENWRPYRTRVTLSLRTGLEDETGEITGRPMPGRPGEVKLGSARGCA